MIEKIYTGIGKRKTSVAKVYLKKGSGNFLINYKTFKEFFIGTIGEENKVLSPLILLNLLDQYDISVIVKGGGISSQMDAICLAISKSLCKIEINYRSILKKNNFLHRDSRVKERKKYGLKKARKASQYSKR